MEGGTSTRLSGSVAVHPTGEPRAPTQPDGGGGTPVCPPGSVAVPQAIELCDGTQPAGGEGIPTRPPGSVDAVPMSGELRNPTIHSLLPLLANALPREPLDPPKDHRRR